MIFALAKHFESAFDGFAHRRSAARVEFRREEVLNVRELAFDLHRAERDDGNLDTLGCKAVGAQLVVEGSQSLIELGDGLPLMEPEVSRSSKQGQRGSGLSANGAASKGCWANSPVIPVS